MDKEEFEYCVFEPSELKQIALYATNLYFNNLSEERKKELMADPVRYTTMVAKVYLDTIREIEKSEEFREQSKPRRR